MILLIENKIQRNPHKFRRLKKKILTSNDIDLPLFTKYSRSNDFWKGHTMYKFSSLNA